MRLKNIIDFCRKCARIPELLENIDRRLEALEKPNFTLKSDFKLPSNLTEPSISWPGSVRLVGTCSPGECEFPSHYVGDFISCTKCGRVITTERTTELTFFT